MIRQKKAGLYYGINRILQYFLAVLMMVITALTFYQVVMRYVFKSAPFWSEEMVRFLFIWVSFVAAAVGIKEHVHIGIDALVNIFPKPVQKVVNILVYLVISIFGATLAYFGWPVVVMTHNQPSPALGIPMSYVYISVPVMGAMIIVYSLFEVIAMLRNAKEG
ncbi:MAG: TRAP transporter small permease [Firmicutes bacterium]|nr:TRAP transporter small permease [Bacillota bacterium]